MANGDDAAVAQAREALRLRFEEEDRRVFYSKQLEVIYENAFFHWITNRAVRQLQEEGLLAFEARELEGPGGQVVLVNHRRHRYAVRDRDRVHDVIQAFSDHKVGDALGHNLEQLVLGGFARNGFTLVAEEANSYGDREWTETGHNLDQIWERDGVAYGIEIKNTWSYIDRVEFEIKTRLAEHIGVVPVFAVRMMPRHWVTELWRRGGFTLVFRWQMYPLILKDLAKRIADELDLPADAPRRLEDGTMQRFLNFHAGVLRRQGPQL